MRVKLKNLNKVHKDRVVLEIEELELESGRIYALLGPNGSGKTTLMRIISGIDRHYSGEVCYDGERRLPVDDVVIMLQNPYLFDSTVMGNVLLALGKSTAAMEEAQAALICVGMQGFSDKKAGTLSGGEAQRVALARTLVTGKKLILLDEPLSSVDRAAVGLAEDYIRKVNKHHGSTIIFSTHSFSQAQRVADEIILLQDGKIVQRGNPSDTLLEEYNRDLSG